MSWFPVDDAFHSHPKARRAGMEALGLWTVSGSFCMAYLTDGFVPEWFVKEKPRGMQLAKRLVSAGLWKPGAKDSENGWWFHDWKPECTKAEIEKARERARLRKRKSREEHANVTVPVTGSVTRDRTCDGRVPSRDCLGPTQPNPTQPINSVVDSGGRVTEVDAREAIPPVCPKHPNGNPADVPCAGCGKVREWGVEHAARLAADDLARQRAIRARAAEALANCQQCDDAGWLLGPDGMPCEPAVKCAHTLDAAHA